MVVVQKTYTRARGIMNAIGVVVMIAAGFFLLLFMPSTKHGSFFGQTIGEDGVAHADAVSCSSCTSAPTDCASFEATSAGGSTGADGTGCTDADGGTGGTGGSDTGT